MRRLVLALAALVSLAFVGNAAATTYYVSPGGADGNAGQSPAAPWRSVGRVNAARLAPGDTVLFEGGQTFTDATLMPSTSGTAGAPITFASYGSGAATISNGRGSVWVSGRSYLVFQHLSLTTGGAPFNIFGGDPANPSDHITLSNSTISNGGATGVISPSHADSHWAVLDNTFANTGDTAITILGSDATVSGNTISNPGTNPSVTWSTHGIYAKGADMTIANNDISHVPNGQAISLRFHGARVYGNRIHDTPYAFAFFDYDTSAAPQGTSYIYGNRAWNITGYGFYYDGQADPQGRAPSVDFVIASNTFLFSGAAEAVNVAPSGSARVQIVNNVFAGSYGSGLRAAATTTASHNDWSGGAFNTPSGAGDLRTVPGLTAAPDLALLLPSPLVDAGTTAAGLAYAPTCSGAPLSYCGAAPDLGASEAAAPAPAPVSAPAPALAPSPAPAPALGPAPAAAAPAPAPSGGGGSEAPPASAPAPAAPAPAPQPARKSSSPPRGRLLSPTAQATVAVAFTVVAAAGDAGGGAPSLTFYLDGSKICIVPRSAATYSCRYRAAPGRHNISISMTDASGNVGWLGETVTVSRSVRVVAGVTGAATAGKHTARKQTRKQTVRKHGKANPRHAASSRRR